MSLYNEQPVRQVVDEPVMLPMDRLGVALVLSSSNRSGTNLYRLDDLEHFPLLSERDRALAVGLLDAVVAKVRAQAGTAAAG